MGVSIVADTPQAQPPKVSALMTIKQALLVLTSFPVPTEARSIENVVTLADNLHATLSAVAFHMDIQSFIAQYGDPFDATGLLSADSKQSAANAQDLLGIFELVANKRGIPHDQSLVRRRPHDIPAYLAEEARFQDISIVPVKEGNEMSRAVAEHLIFASGRPVLILPDDPGRALPESPGNIAVAWDFSRSVTRAVADALPFLQSGKQVRIFTVADDKTTPEARSGTALSEYLARHEVEAMLDNVKARGRSIGRVFREYVSEHNVELLVMGGYGHSRMREFILGGATRSILAQPPTWTLLSH
jgi:nucleotide-binding universal stress UspA family protein